MNVGFIFPGQGAQFVGMCKDIADACLYLASDMSSYVTGTVLSVNGGLLIF